MIFLPHNFSADLNLLDLVFVPIFGIVPFGFSWAIRNCMLLTSWLNCRMGFWSAILRPPSSDTSLELLSLAFSPPQVDLDAFFPPFFLFIFTGIPFFFLTLPASVPQRHLHYSRSFVISPVASFPPSLPPPLVLG